MPVIGSEWRAQETQETVSQSFLFAGILIFDAAIFDVLRHSGVKIETYSVAQAGEN
jgi:hypothetical protein